MRLVAALAPLVVCLADAHAAPAEQVPRTSVHARIDVEARAVEGTVAVTFANRSRAHLDRVYLWLYPNRFAQPPAALDDVTYYWIYPRGFNRGSMSLTAVRAARRPLAADAWQAEPHGRAGREVLWSLRLPEPLAPGAAITLELDYRARIPERYGSFGCHDQVCTLMGGFYPMLADLDEGGWRLDAAPMRTAMEVEVELPTAADAVLFGRWTPGRDGRVRGRASAAYASLLLAPRWYPSRRQAAGVDLVFLGRRAPPPADDARGQVLPYTQEDHAGFALEAAAEAVDFAAALPGARPEALVLVEAPLRFDIGEVHPGLVLVSDRYFRIWPARRFRKFHERQLVRSVLTAFLAPRFRAADGRWVEAAEVADGAAAYLTDLFVLRQYQKSEFMGDILQPVSFIPAVDQLLYAPQTMFADAYFGSVVDDEPLRDHPRRFTHERPRGRLYYEKLRDLLEPRALQEVMRAVIEAGEPLEEAAARAYGSSLTWFFRQWSLPQPRLNYRLAGVRSSRVDGGGYEHVITVEQQVAAGDQPPVEPVRILVIDEAGQRHQLVWDGRGTTGTVRVRAAAPVDSVVIDPGGRLVEQRLPGANTHPRFDNRSAHRTRFVYNSFGVLLDFSSLSNALLAADFTVGRVHDVKNRVGMTLFRSAGVQAGLTGRYRRAFGPPVHQDKLLAAASTSLTLQRLNAGFFAGPDDVERPATELRVGVALGADDRLFAFEPREVRSLGASAGLTLTRRDRVGDLDAEYLTTGTLSAGYTRITSPLPSHTFVFDLDAAVVVGDIRARSQLLGGGGPTRLRGFAPGELFGRARLLGHLEWRHVFVHDLSWNLGHYNYVRGIGGAAYLDAGLLSPCDSYDLTSRDSAYLSAGYALHGFYDSFGTLPQMIRLDVAVRLAGSSRACFGVDPGSFPPVMVYLGFLPPF